MNGQAGKGDTYRPIDWKKWDAAWERAFGKHPKRKRRVTNRTASRRSGGRKS